MSIIYLHRGRACHTAPASMPLCASALLAAGLAVGGKPFEDRTHGGTGGPTNVTAVAAAGAYVAAVGDDGRVYASHNGAITWNTVYEQPVINTATHAPLIAVSAQHACVASFEGNKIWCCNSSAEALTSDCTEYTQLHWGSSSLTLGSITAIASCNDTAFAVGVLSNDTPTAQWYILIVTVTETQLQGELRLHIANPSGFYTEQLACNSGGDLFYTSTRPDTAANKTLPVTPILAGDSAITSFLDERYLNGDNLPDGFLCATKSPSQMALCQDHDFVIFLVGDESATGPAVSVIVRNTPVVTTQVSATSCVISTYYDPNDEIFCVDDDDWATLDVTTTFEDGNSGYLSSIKEVAVSPDCTELYVLPGDDNILPLRYEIPSDLTHTWHVSEANTDSSTALNRPKHGLTPVNHDHWYDTHDQFLFLATVAGNKGRLFTRTGAHWLPSECSDDYHSVQGSSYPKGCAGAVWSSHSPSPAYCANTEGTRQNYWYPKCCTWSGSSCEPKSAYDQLPSRHTLYLGDEATSCDTTCGNLQGNLECTPTITPGLRHIEDFSVALVEAYLNTEETRKAGQLQLTTHTSGHAVVVTDDILTGVLNVNNATLCATNNNSTSYNATPGLPAYYFNTNGDGAQDNIESNGLCFLPSFPTCDQPAPDDAFPLCDCRPRSQFSLQTVPPVDATHDVAAFAVDKTGAVSSINITAGVFNIGTSESANIRRGKVPSNASATTLGGDFELYANYSSAETNGQSPIVAGTFETGWAWGFHDTNLLYYRHPDALQTEYVGCYNIAPGMNPGFDVTYQISSAATFQECKQAASNYTFFGMDTPRTNGTFKADCYGFNNGTLPHKVDDSQCEQIFDPVSGHRLGSMQKMATYQRKQIAKAYSFALAGGDWGLFDLDVSPDGYIWAVVVPTRQSLYHNELEPSTTTTTTLDTTAGTTADTTTSAALYREYWVWRSKDPKSIESFTTHINDTLRYGTHEPITSVVAMYSNTAHIVKGGLWTVLAGVDNSPHTYAIQAKSNLQPIQLRDATDEQQTDKRLAVMYKNDDYWIAVALGESGTLYRMDKHCNYNKAMQITPHISRLSNSPNREVESLTSVALDPAGRTVITSATKVYVGSHTSMWVQRTLCNNVSSERFDDMSLIYGELLDPAGSYEIQRVEYGSYLIAGILAKNTQDATYTTNKELIAPVVTAPEETQTCAINYCNTMAEHVGSSTTFAGNATYSICGGQNCTDADDLQAASCWLEWSKSEDQSCVTTTSTMTMSSVTTSSTTTSTMTMSSVTTSYTMSSTQPRPTAAPTPHPTDAGRGWNLTDFAGEYGSGYARGLAASDDGRVVIVGLLAQTGTCGTTCGSIHISEDYGQSFTRALTRQGHKKTQNYWLISCADATCNTFAYANHFPDAASSQSAQHVYIAKIDNSTYDASVTINNGSAVNDVVALEMLTDTTVAVAYQVVGNSESYIELLDVSDGRLIRSTPVTEDVVALERLTDSSVMVIVELSGYQVAETFSNEDFSSSYVTLPNDFHCAFNGLVAARATDPGYKLLYANKTLTLTDGLTSLPTNASGAANDTFTAGLECATAIAIKGKTVAVAAPEASGGAPTVYTIALNDDHPGRFYPGAGDGQDHSEVAGHPFSDSEHITDLALVGDGDILAVTKKGLYRSYGTNGPPTPTTALTAPPTPTPAVTPSAAPTPAVTPAPTPAVTPSAAPTPAGTPSAAPTPAVTPAPTPAGTPSAAPTAATVTVLSTTVPFEPESSGGGGGDGGDNTGAIIGGAAAGVIVLAGAGYAYSRWRKNKGELTGGGMGHQRLL